MILTYLHSDVYVLIRLIRLIWVGGLVVVWWLRGRTIQIETKIRETQPGIRKMEDARARNGDRCGCIPRCAVRMLFDVGKLRRRMTNDGRGMYEIRFRSRGVCGSK